MACLHGPFGLPLGGQTPEEIALVILAEIVAVRHGEKIIESQPDSFTIPRRV